MITLLVLVSLICTGTQDGTRPDDGVSLCGPQNLRLTSSAQTILSAWEDDPSCSAVNDMLVYELVVLRADKQVHHEEVAVTPDQIGSTHFWNWTSHLALECVSHSVRLSSRYKNHASPLKLEETLPGKENSAEPEVYPRDRIIKVGSNVTFCCVLPAGQTFERMYVTGYSTNVDATKISNRTYALTVHLTQTTSVICTNVKCKARTQQQESTDNGACALIGYPPGDKDLRCETRDLESVACHWTVGRNTHLHTNPTTYKLLGRHCAGASPGRCSQKVRVNASETTWTLTAQNELGTVELSERADLTRRVYMFAPEGVTASTVNARNVSLEWSWTVKRYNNLNITCQVNVRHGGTDATSEDFGVGLASAVLTGLMPKWTYNASVRCRTMEHSWKWSEWSTALVFQTRGDVPDALDVWMQMKKKQITIFWKMLPDNQSHGHIIDYTVTWAKKTTETERRNTTTVDHNEQRVVLSVDTTDQYLVTVTARNTNGSSSPSTITTPHFNPDTTRLNTFGFTGSNGRVSLSWSASPAARCGYVVDWHPTSDPWIVDWLKVPPHETNATIFSKNFQSGLRYSFSISACTQAAPVLLERGEGYVWEEKIQDGLFKTLTWKQKGSDVEVSWLPISPTEQSAFIQGYILYWSDNNNDDSHNVVFNVSTDLPGATSLRARDLKIGSYRFTVKAQTAVGECGTTSLTVTLNSLTDNLITATFISLVAVFSLLSLVTVVCYRHWACIKQNVYPPIPKPLLTDKWLKSMGGHSCRPLYVDQCPHSEVEVLDIPVLLRDSGAPDKGHVGHKNASFAFTQKGYFNQPLKNPPPPALIPTNVTPALEGLPSSPFRGVFPNPSYNLIMQPGDPPAGSGPELREATCLECDPDGYQPHSGSDTSVLNPTGEETESPMACVFTYVLLPQSTS
ncbi:leukemia inhibitory factor receptor [Scophthalmus maximus]|uniref:leukemia inhibitory factor receptor n=1 Tax=Scophthalmus maximus TaxID=52904 RepID=UPI001FA820B7|nr:leukemia inhibitory factor receptor [Scophthalmus maximus]XP_047185528.1 leukemia inhibitory factor receptor [Scophthalmus maximus]